MISIALAAALAAAAPSGSGFDQRCARLAALTQAGLEITGAVPVAAGPAPADPLANPNGPPAGPRPMLPAHCKVSARIDPRTGADGQPYAIGIELRIPTDWNGRFLYQGGGGLDGVVMPAIGGPTIAGSTAPVPLARGFAVVSTDSGHAGMAPNDARFAKDQQAKLDYGYAAIGKVAAASKQLIAAVTGAAPHHSYFAGCSNGGREAMMAAQRFPEAFDGVLACNPAFRLSHAAILSNYSGWVYAEAAAKQGLDAAHLFQPADADVFSKALLDACDGLDGARDGMIFDHDACRFDIRAVQCKLGQAEGCLSPAKVEAIVHAFRGPVDHEGRTVAGSWTFDTADFTFPWLLWQTGAPLPNGQSMTLLRDLVRGSITDYFAFPAMTTPLTGGDAEAIRLIAETAPTAAVTDAVSTQLTSFEQRGGKMMLVTGWSDPIFSASDLVGWYRQMSADMEQATGRKADGFARLFLVPGMVHCGGGPSLDDFDALGSLVAWTEEKKTPDAFVAQGRAFPGVSRPICAFPKVARYGGAGPVDKAESFACR